MDDEKELLDWTKTLHSENKDLKKVITIIGKVIYDKDLLMINKIDKIKEIFDNLHSSNISPTNPCENGFENTLS